MWSHECEKQQYTAALFAQKAFDVVFYNSLLFKLCIDRIILYYWQMKYYIYWHHHPDVMWECTKSNAYEVLIQLNTITTWTISWTRWRTLWNYYSPILPFPRENIQRSYLCNESSFTTRCDFIYQVSTFLKMTTGYKTIVIWVDSPTFNTY